MSTNKHRCHRVLYHLILTTALLLPGLSHAVPADTDHGAPSLTYRLKLNGVLRNAPDGRIAGIWKRGTLFTSNQEKGEWVRIDGQFRHRPQLYWEPLEQPRWINTHYVETISTDKAHQAPTSARPAGVKRYVEVNKSTFELKVFEEKEKQKRVIFKTIVALGMDRCMPKSRGGNCYYTEPGEYKVRWKVHDPDGIEWCVPKSMEKEYPRLIARGKRCIRGVLGSYALNIGKTYAIHGTDSPSTLGKRASHGCVRTANRAVKLIYDLLDIGDKVFILE